LKAADPCGRHIMETPEISFALAGFSKHAPALGNINGGSCPHHTDA
jgi:hypothetical protein